MKISYRSLKGIIYCSLWYFSILCGFLTLCCPMLPLFFINLKAYRNMMDLIFAVWELYPVGLMEIFFGTEIIVSGDPVRPWERSILVMNHRTRLDWNFLWAAMHYATTPPAHRLKFVLKAPIRHAPGPGWVMQMAGFFYIHRKWENDQHLLNQQLDYLKELDHTYQLLIFPEGTDLTKNNIIKSNSYADKNNLKHYSRVLHPKTTGFVHLASKMRMNGHLDAVYDLCVGYPESLPETEIDVLRGIFPEKVNFVIKRYPASELPPTDEGLKEWLCDLWEKKEDILIRFYNEGKFESESSARVWPRPISNSLHLSVLFWTLLIFVTFYLALTSFYFQVWVAVHCGFFVLLSFTSQGMHHMEIAWFRMKHKQHVRNKVQ